MIILKGASWQSPYLELTGADEYSLQRKDFLRYLFHLPRGLSEDQCQTAQPPR
ncbi:MAG: hypothetical protein OXF06_11925 [Bacteroidetes bacterium]|nr:hypothetical protein [Bacteroidota bacterium]MCY4225531.1 hypothetical protein [Bacteroidota bacterium]